MRKKIIKATVSIDLQPYLEDDLATWTDFESALRIKTEKAFNEVLKTAMIRAALSEENMKRQLFSKKT